MPALTPAHRDHARRTLIASGYPIGDDVDALERIRRTELLEAVATAIALAEQRGPGPDLVTAWDEGMEAGYNHARYVPGPAGVHPDPPRNPYDVEPVVGGLLETDEPQPDEDLCAHPRGYKRDALSGPGGLRRCVDCGDVKPRRTAADRRADRMSWSPGDLQITPPPPDDAP